MPGFRHCPWCDGKGCMCCEAEQKKFVEKAIANAPAWRPGDVRDVRDAWVQAETNRGWEGLDSLTPDQVEELFKPALDAEYERQFPGGPKPVFTARRANPDDMALFKSFAGGPALDGIFADGVTEKSFSEMARLIDAARLTQAARQVLCPNADDLTT